MIGETDWVRIGLEAAASLISGSVGIVAGIWRAGRRSAQRELAVRDEFDGKIDALRREFAVSERSSREERGVMTGQFAESFNGMRRQIDDQRLHLEVNFVRKDDFREFREEYRDDMRDLKASIAAITGPKTLS